MCTSTTWSVLGRNNREIHQAEKVVKPKKKDQEARTKTASENVTSEDEEDQEEVMMIQTPWMQAYLAYLINKEIPEDPVEARRIIRRSKAFTIINKELYKRSITSILQRCITPEEGRIILKDIH